MLYFRLEGFVMRKMALVYPKLKSVELLSHQLESQYVFFAACPHNSHLRTFHYIPIISRCKTCSRKHGYRQLLALKQTPWMNGSTPATKNLTDFKNQKNPDAHQNNCAIERTKHSKLLPSFRN